MVGGMGDILRIRPRFVGRSGYESSTVFNIGSRVGSSDGVRGAINILNNGLEVVEESDNNPIKIKIFISNYEKFSSFCPEVKKEFEKDYLILKEKL